MATFTGSVGATLTLSSPILLTTTFVPDAACLSDVYKYFPVESNAGESGEYFLHLGPPDATKCLPSGWASTSQYFSPGVCPSGYSQACWATSSAGTDIETLATCCPSGYTCATLPSESYASWLPVLYSTEVCVGTGGRGSSLGTFAVTKVVDGTTATSNTILEGGVNAYGVSIRFQAKAATATGSGGGSSGSSSATISSDTGGISSTTITSSTASSTSTSTGSSNTKSGLSTGAKAGIGAGAAVLGAALLAFLIWFALRRRRGVAGNGHEQSLMHGKLPMYGGVPVLNSELAGAEKIKPELGSDRETGELPGHGVLVNRPGRGDVQELG